MNSVEMPGNKPSSSTEAEEVPGDDPDCSSASEVPEVPHYHVVLLFQDGRSADLVVPGVTGMSGSGDAAGPGRLSIHGPVEGSLRGTRRLLGARLFTGLADLVVVAESLELEIDEAPESGP